MHAGEEPDLLNDPTGRLLAQLAAPAAQYLPPYAGAEIPTHLLYDQAVDAWARLYQSSAGSWKVRQAGPVDLWDEALRDEGAEKAGRATKKAPSKR